MVIFYIIVFTLIFSLIVAAFAVNYHIQTQNERFLDELNQKLREISRKPK